MTSEFSAATDAQLAEARQATNTAKIGESTRTDPEPSSTSGVFAGDEDALAGALREAGWSYCWFEAPFHWCMEAPDGSALTLADGYLRVGYQEPPGTDSLPDSAQQVAAADFPGPPEHIPQTPPAGPAPEPSAETPSPERSPRHGGR